MITLEQAKVGMADHIDQNIIDTIQRSSRFMDLLPFDDTLSPGTGGSTLVFGYTQLKTPGVAEGRKINSEYSPKEAARKTEFTTLSIMGGSYQIDRVLARTTNQQINEVAFQNDQKAKATTSRFQYLAINGVYDESSEDPEFTGLSSLLLGTENEFDGSSVDISGTMTKELAEKIAEALDDAISSIAGGKPDVILCNSKVKTKLNAVARTLGYYTYSEDSFGKPVDKYDGIEIIDLKQYYNGKKTVDVIPIREKEEYKLVKITAETFTTNGSLYTDKESAGNYTPVQDGSFEVETKYYKKVADAKTSDIYFVRLGLDAFCGVTPEGGSIGLSVHLPNFDEAKAVHTGDVELVGGVALKNTKAAAVIRGVVVSA